MSAINGDVVEELIDRWLNSRARLREIEESEHPDIVDKYGRVWKWWFGEVYRHDQLAWRRADLDDGHYGLPSPELATNPNYDLCAICRQEWSVTPPAEEGEVKGHANYPHETGQLPGCPACDEIISRGEARATIRRTNTAIIRHLKTCETCDVRSSDPQFCAEIQPTVTAHDEAESLTAALDELKNSDS